MMCNVEHGNPWLFCSQSRKCLVQVYLQLLVCLSCYQTWIPQLLNNLQMFFLAFLILFVDGKAW